MTDNVAITAGSGTTIATDDIGGVQYQRAKMVWGVDGTANDVSASNPLPISASAKQAFGSVDTFTITNLNSLATSATAGWRSAAVDNTSNLYSEYAVQLVLAAVNTAAANSKAFFLYLYSILDTSGSDYTTTGATSGGAPDGTEGTLTFPDITANAVNLRLLAVIPYIGTNTKIISPWIQVAPALGGLFLPPKFGFALINHSGFTIASSGNSFKGVGLYNRAV